MTNPFEMNGYWLKGSLHTHTTQSDGALSPAENIRWHEENGYDFVAITDHDLLTVPHAYCEPHLVTLLGSELSLGVTAGGGPFHLLAIGLPSDFNIPKANSLNPPAAIELVSSHRAICFVAHPHWSAMTMEELAACQGYVGIEVFNYGCHVENRTGFAETYWDDLLRRRRPLWGFATDDSHWRYSDYGGGWIMLRAAERSSEAILAAIQAGHFYASSGPEIRHISVVNNKLYVESSPAQAICWTEGPRGWSAHANGKEWITEAEFELKARTYFRVQVVDAQGNSAWSNPYFVS